MRLTRRQFLGLFALAAVPRKPHRPVVAGGFGSAPFGTSRFGG